MTNSVRESLELIGRSGSVRQIVRARGGSFPLWLRAFIGATPAGRRVRKTVPLSLLQQKFDVFANNRTRPMFEVRVDSKERKYGHNQITVAADSVFGYDHENASMKWEAGDALEGMYFQDFRTKNINLEALQGVPAVIKASVIFEADGPIEIKRDSFPSEVDIVGLIAWLKLEVSSSDGLVTLTGAFEEIERSLELMHIITSAPATGKGLWFAKAIADFRGRHVDGSTSGISQASAAAGARVALRDQLLAEFFYVNASVDASIVDGTAARKIESQARTAVFDALRGDSARDALRKLATRWITGGDFFVTDLTCDGQAIYVEYVIPNGGVEPFPEVSQPPLEPGSLANIDHIVVLMMENRSFDHMLGYLRRDRGRTDIDGLHGTETNSYRGVQYSPQPRAPLQFPISPPHGHTPVIDQIGGGRMDGFVAAFAQHLSGQDPHGVTPGDIMNYHSAADVNVYDQLAEQFMICNRWFAAHPGPTFCNRFFTLTGRLNRDQHEVFELDNFSGDAFRPVATRTLFDHLTEHGVSWRYYEHDYCFLRLFANYTFEAGEHIVPADPGFFDDARNGTLPSVAFIDPNFVDVYDGRDNDDGAPSHLTRGQRLVGKVVQALASGPKWGKTLLIVTYDEHGGFYDHVSPLDPANRQHAVPVSGIDHYGVRVPTFVISPWVARRSVSNVVFDHTSIAKTIARRFMSARPPDMGARVAAADDLSLVLQPTPRTEAINIALPPEPPADGVARTVPTHDPDDMRELLRSVRTRYPLPQ
jgi:phospholipase C